MYHPFTRPRVEGFDRCAAAAEGGVPNDLLAPIGGAVRSRAANGLGALKPVNIVYRLVDFNFQIPFNSPLALVGLLSRS